jgi:DNA-binding CsgD family transcriptional regulator
MSSPKPLGHFPQPATKVSVALKWPRARGTNTARVGLVLLDSSLKPIYCNSEARSIFAYPNQPAKAPNAEFSESIRSIVGKKPGADDFPTTTHFVSGGRRYLCRIFVLEPESNGGSKPTIAITVERDSVLLDLVARFQLTDREVEAVQHLADGFTSKEIAQRMNISPNTVKTFFRLVMIKMGVTTRSGVIGKLVHGAHFRDE